MKKLLLSIIAVFAAVSSFATDVWEGTHHVSWDTPLNIEAAKFDGLQAGQKIVFEVANAKDVIEMHSNGTMLPGSRFCTWINGEQNVEMFVTNAMLAQINATGLEVCGADFDLKKVWFGDGKDNVTANTVWTGYFWMDEWSTLEISKNCFEGVDWSTVSAIRFCSEANRTDYVINVKVNWDGDGHIASREQMTMTNDYAELPLDGIDMAAFLAKSDRLMIQCNKEGGAPFNFTAVELVMNEASSIKTVETVSSSAAYDLSGRKVSANTKGLIISNGIKYVRK